MQTRLDLLQSDSYPTRADLGCGFRTRDILDDTLRVDRNPACNPDLVWDLNREWPPEWDDQFYWIEMNHVLEHLNDFWFVWNSLYRALKPGGKVSIYTPHALSITAWSDPTHKRGYTLRSFQSDQLCGCNCPPMRIVLQRLIWRPEWPKLSKILDLGFFGEKYLSPFLGGYHEMHVCLQKEA